MRRALLAAVFGTLFVASSPAHAGAKQWTIEPPPGWTLDHDASSAALTEIEDAEIVDTEAEAFRAPDQSVLLVFSLTVQLPTLNARRDRIDWFEGLARREGKSSELSYAQREAGNHVIVDQVIREGDRKHIRRIYAVDADDQLRVVSATCATDESGPTFEQCEAALDTLALTVRGESLEGGREEMWLRIVIALGILGVLLGGFFLLTRRKS